MHSQEIKKLLEVKEHLLEVEEYINILQTSPQIYYHNYNKESEVFELKTDDNYDFKFKVKMKEPTKK